MKWFIVIGAVALAIIYVGAQGEQQWQVFATAHHCHEVERLPGSMYFQSISTGDGNAMLIPITNPDQVAYLCDDGVKHWR